MDLRAGHHQVSSLRFVISRPPHRGPREAPLLRLVGWHGRPRDLLFYPLTTIHCSRRPPRTPLPPQRPHPAKGRRDGAPTFFLSAPRLLPAQAFDGIEAGGA